MATPMLLHSLRLSTSSSYHSCRLFFLTLPSLLSSKSATLTSLWLWFHKLHCLLPSQGPVQTQPQVRPPLAKSQHLVCFLTVWRTTLSSYAAFVFLVKLFRDIISLLCFNFFPLPEMGAEAKFIVASFIFSSTQQYLAEWVGVSTTVEYNVIAG